MLTPQDDLLGHQTSDDFSKVAWNDTKGAMYTERFWYMGTLVPEGNFVFGLGLGYYPNRGVMDCYAAVTAARVQHNFRASRAAGLDPLQPRVGPLQIQVVAGMHRHRLILEANQSDISLDLEFVGRMEPHDEGREVVQHKGMVVSDVRRFAQSGAFQGRIIVAGKSTDVTLSNSIGFRDRSWGLRVEARTDESTPPVSKFPPIFYCFLCVQFEGYSIHLFFKETAPGEFRFLAGNLTQGIRVSSPDMRTAIRHVEHDLTWRAGAMSQELAGGRLTIGFDNGTAKTLEIEALDGRLFLKGGLYGGLDGWFQGDSRGPLHIESNTWDLANAADRRVARTLAEQVVKVRDGHAIGFGTVQCGVGSGYPKYLEVQHHPAQ